MQKYTIEGCDLIVGGTRRTFDAPISDHVDFANFVVVQLKASNEMYSDKYRNVIAVNDDGTIRWRIPERPNPGPKQYSSIHTKDGDDLWAYNTGGMLYEVDPETGDIIGQQWKK